MARDLRRRQRHNRIQQLVGLTMSDTISKWIAASSIAALAGLTAYNLGRLSALAQARQCPPPVVQFGGLPFKGSMP